MSEQMHWSADLHMAVDQKPFFGRHPGSDAAAHLAFSDIYYPMITLYANTPAQRRWLDAMLAASKAFWLAEAIAEQDQAEAIEAEEKAQERADNGQFGVGA